MNDVQLDILLVCLAWLAGHLCAKWEHELRECRDNLLQKLRDIMRQ